jgi:hypothetical protein
MRELDGERSCFIEPEHLIGRSPRCSLRLTKGYVSAQHAAIRWTGSGWELLDRGSRNGTYLAGEAIQAGRPCALELGSVIAFGHLDERWEVCDVSPPEAMVIAGEGELALLGGDGVIGIPPGQDPECTVYRDVDGTWKIELGEHPASVIRNGDVFEVHGRSWRFCNPEPIRATETVEHERVDTPPTLRFTVSSDEEFVELAVEYERTTINVGSRAHNYLLLTLARARLRDRENGLGEASCGWVYKEQLADDLVVSPQQVDGEVFRIRKHFAHHGVKEAASIIERRPRTKQLRIGLSKLRVTTP